MVKLSPAYDMLHCNRQCEITMAFIFLLLRLPILSTFVLSIHLFRWTRWVIHTQTLHSQASGQGYLCRYSDLPWVGRSGNRIPVVARHSAPAQTGPGTTQPPVIWVTGLKRAWRGVIHPPQSSAEVKERAHLYLYSHSGIHGLFYGNRYLLSLAFTL
jgi:hypothetical protein